MAVENVEIKTM